jgi:hypothetical protein
MYINFHLFYMLCFRGLASCSKKVVDCKLLAVLLYIFSIRVGEIHAHTFLIHVHSTFFIMRSFSLTLNDCKRIPRLLIFGYNGHSAPHTMPSGGVLL